MPLPFILAGAAIVAGGYGIKKGFDAKSDYDQAERVNNRAQKIYDEQSTKLDSARKSANRAMNSLGKYKFKTYQQFIIPFVEIFSTIKNIDFITPDISSGGIPQEKDTFLEMRSIALEMKDVVSGGISSLGAGGLAGLAAYGSVGTLASASTGTAIASLSGAAATNATLAWLGGGAISAGGLGMAGGTAVLGGIVAGPVLAVGGMMLASKAEEAVHNAYSNLEKAELAVEEMKTATVATRAIRKRFRDLHQLLSELNQTFEVHLGRFVTLARSNQDYKTYAADEKKLTYATFQMAATIKQLLELKLISDDGCLTSSPERVMQEARKALPSPN